MASIFFFFLLLLGILACSWGPAEAHPVKHAEAGNVSCDVLPPFLSYHIHVLFWQTNNESFAGAIQLRDQFNTYFQLQDYSGSPDRCNDWPAPPSPIRLCYYDIDPEPTGPFLTAQYSWFVPTTRFFDTVPWIMQHRGIYDIFVHPNSGCEVEDHTLWPVWGGNKWEVDPSIFNCDYPGCQQPPSTATP